MTSPFKIGLDFLRLGCTSFGGPVAHLGYLRDAFVTRRRWLDDAAYADLVALCQFLPGPTSSQVVFGLGLRRGGLRGACLASLGFTLPSAVLMTLFAYGVASLGALEGAAWLQGLKLAAAAVVAHAVLQMALRLCRDGLRIAVALGTAGLVLAAPMLLPADAAPQAGALVQLGALLLAGAIGATRYRAEAQRAAAAMSPAPPARGHHAAVGALLLGGALLIVLPWIAAATGSRDAQLCAGFYRSGALIFGGGHVMLPLLYTEVVPPGLLDDATFLAGYGAAQAIPGPLSTFAAYLGAAIDLRAGGSAPWAVAALATVAIFLPSWLLVGGAWPFWSALQRRVTVRAALFGTNAAVVGLLGAALVRPVCAEALHGPPDVALALGGFALLQLARAPAWLVVIALGLASEALA
ncbi:MAG: chromate efflux transporter [Planctomycetota bacterium]